MRTAKEVLRLARLWIGVALIFGAIAGAVFFAVWWTWPWVPIAVWSIAAIFGLNWFLAQAFDYLNRRGAGGRGDQGAG